MVWVALAGPMANLVQALLWGAAFLILSSIGISERFWFEMCRAGLLVNVVMFVFNLFPLPPMDGGRILVGLLPWRQANLVARIEPYGFFIVLALLIAGVISNLWMRPLMGLTEQFINLVLTPLRLIL
jgi:Zn-dependent protease